MTQRSQLITCYGSYQHAKDMLINKVDVLNLRCHRNTRPGKLYPPIPLCYINLMTLQLCQWIKPLSHQVLHWLTILLYSVTLSSHHQQEVTWWHQECDILWCYNLATNSDITFQCLIPDIHVNMTLLTSSVKQQYLVTNTYFTSSNYAETLIVVSLFYHFVFFFLFKSVVLLCEVDVRWHLPPCHSALSPFFHRSLRLSNHLLFGLPVSLLPW